jgi:FAD/FMN-containing dehydrogenase
MAVSNRKEPSIGERAIQTLKEQMDGEVLQPGDAGYDEARAVWNGMIDKRPGLIARCRTAQDVIASVNFARENDVAVAVRGGGHNVAGHAVLDGGLVIDLSEMRWVDVDPQARTVRAGGGATIADVDRATQPHGLAVPLGVVSETGIAGLTLGGGYGWLRNRYGLSCDNLIAAEVVTADGRILKANEAENADLLWGLRGGGGNLGIVTDFEFRAHPVGPEVYFTAVFHHGDKAKEGLRFYREYNASAPDEVSTLAMLGVFPEGAEVFPEEVHGLPFVAFVGMYAGPVEEGERVMQPLRSFEVPLVDFSGPTTYLEAQQTFDEDYPAGELRYYWKSLNLMSLTDAAIERIIEHARQQPSQLSTTDLWPVGGAVKALTGEDAAFHGRHAAFLLNPEANWEDPTADGANIAWAQAMVADMQEFSDGSRYLNFAGFQEEGDDMMRSAFGPRYQRLASLKKKYDPTNFFRLNQNVKPSG